jgi:sugar-specific transcriptional regulator TrmB
MLEKYLQEIGLSDKEASVYAKLLEVDSDTVLDLSKKTKINRTTIYPVLESLQKKGLVSEIKMDKKVQYQAESPDRLETFVERQKVVLEERSTRLKDIIPQLKSVQRESGERPVVKYYEGREGIIASSEEFFSPDDKGGDMYLVYPRDLLSEIFTESERVKYKTRRVDKDIKTKVIYTSSSGEIVDSTGTRVKIDQKKYPITCDISIYKDRIRIHTLKKSLAGIFIRSQDIADTLRSLMDLIHDSIKKA